jgi:hypothetical protein
VSFTPERAETSQQRFLLDRFARLLHRRLQVEVALKQMPGEGSSQTWLVRALDGSIADELRLLQRLGLEEAARESLESFRQTMRWLAASQDEAA